ncbi:uncharacterized protein MELLADRAFT_66068 [Melampsora larici-populina 98AG31]|uniref:Uncharacterized protein n=1 Tax=Melampsora larici-populina (strain 98AG31 / pathotype 3-4-7) TaxID=747676 RepID=F4RXR5_MELLP|nr:uncharacterized protein MELLADRAFT_66068 [Melampsora larici-populina 98AG31]EGG02852.1 hypothetical protein MELLADRAFT_66068 [Melampsora larici-populina 98AG31]
MPNSVLMSAILPTTAEARNIVQIPKFVDWRLTAADLVLRDALGEPLNEPLKAYGYSMDNKKLELGRIYHLFGPFGQHPISGEAMIRHDQTAQSDLGAHTINRQEIAGNAYITSKGKVMDAEYDNVHNSNGSWNLTVVAEHEFVVPEPTEAFDFEVIYWFGYYTPHGSQWKRIKSNAIMSFSGKLVGKDPASGRFIVDVIDYAFIEV